MGEATATAKQNAAPDDRALEPVKMPIPKAAPARTREIDPTRLTTEEIVDPSASPSLDHADPHTLLKVVKLAIEPIFAALDESLKDVEAQLTAPPPVRDPSLAVQLLSLFVQVVAGAALGEVSARIAGRVTGAFGDVAGTAAGDALKAVTKSEAAAAGDWFKTKVPVSSASEEPHSKELPAAPGAPLVREFIKREKLALGAKKLAAETSIELAGAALPRINQGSLLALSRDLTALANGPELSNWFEHKVVIEWQNFLARLSIAQYSGDLGTNSITTSSVADIELRKLDGFVDVTVDVPDEILGIAGCVVKNAHMEKAGAAAILNDAPYSLATIPVYRRVWLTQGASMLSLTPVLLIAPNGELQADLHSPLLAAIGNGDYTWYRDATMAGSDRNVPAAVAHGLDAAAGARALVNLLGMSDLKVLS